jgi:hypothetical protein
VHRMLWLTRKVVVMLMGARIEHEVASSSIQVTDGYWYILSTKLHLIVSRETFLYANVCNHYSLNETISSNSITSSFP